MIPQPAVCPADLSGRLEAIAGCIKGGFGLAVSLLLPLMNLLLAIGLRFLIAGRPHFLFKVIHFLLPSLDLFRAVRPLSDPFIDGGLFFFALATHFLKAIDHRLEPVEALSEDLHVQKWFKMPSGFGRLGIERPGQPPLFHTH